MIKFISLYDMLDVMQGMVYIYINGFSDIKSPNTQHLFAILRITSTTQVVCEPFVGGDFVCMVKLGWYSLLMLQMPSWVTWFALAVPCDLKVEGLVHVRRIYN